MGVEPIPLIKSQYSTIEISSMLVAKYVIATWQHILSGYCLPHPIYCCRYGNYQHYEALSPLHIRYGGTRTHIQFIILWHSVYYSVTFNLPLVKINTAPIMSTYRTAVYVDFYSSFNEEMENVGIEPIVILQPYCTYQYHFPLMQFSNGVCGIWTHATHYCALED